MPVPSIYREGYAKARLVAPDLADNFMRYTMLGDPLADAATESLAGFDRIDAHHLVRACMDDDDEAMRAAPLALRDFFEAVGAAPAWVDERAMAPGRAAYHDNVYEFVLGLVAGSIVRGYATTICKPFAFSGRTLASGRQRYRQNMRHILEIMLPGGLARTGEGWKLSVRTRLIHAQIRRLLLQSGAWNIEEQGWPLSAAHVFMAAALFSARNVDYAAALGAHLSARGVAGFIAVWRYTAWLLGVPDALLFRDKPHAEEQLKVGLMCEPPPDVDSTMMAHNIINAGGVMFGLSDLAERRKLARDAYRVSRALLGNDLADTLDFPKANTTLALALMRGRRRFTDALGRLAPEVTRRRRAEALRALLTITDADDRELGIGYLGPTSAREEESEPW